MTKTGNFFQPGDWVTITRSPNNWASGMNKWIGSTVQLDNSRYCFRGGEGFHWDNAQGHFRHAFDDEIPLHANNVVEVPEPPRYPGEGMVNHIMPHNLVQKTVDDELDIYLKNYKVKFDDTAVSYVVYGTGGDVSPGLVWNNPYSVEKKNKAMKKSSDNAYKLFKYIPINGAYGYGLFDAERRIVVYPKISNKNGDVIQKLKLEEVDKDYKPEKYFSLQALIDTCAFRVKDYKLSGKLYRNSAQKEKLVGKILNVHSFEFDVENPKEEGMINTLYVDSEFGNLRMVLDDIEIIYPNIKGFKPKLDKTLVKITRRGEILDIKINIGDSLVIKNPKGIKNAEIKDVIIVKKIKPIGNIVYIGFKGKFNKTKELDWVSIKHFKKLEYNVVKEKIKEELISW